MEVRTIKNTPKWGWYCIQAFDIAAKLGPMELLTYLAMTRIAFDKQSPAGITASRQEIASVSGLGLRTIVRTIPRLEEQNLVQLIRTEGKCLMYKLLKGPVPVRHDTRACEAQPRATGAQTRACEAQVYSVAKITLDRNKSRLQREFVSKEEETDHASAPPLGAGPESSPGDMVRTSAWKTFVQEVYDLENS